MSDENKNDENDGSNIKDPEPSLDGETKEYLVRLVNAAVGGRMSRETKKLEDMINGLSEKLTTPAHAPPKADDKSDKTVNTQVQQLQAQLDATRAEMKASEQKTIERDTRGTIRDAFERHGVTGPRAKAAMAVLYTEEKTIRREDDGNVYFFAREKGVTEPIPLDLDSGIERFLTTDEGKMYLPPKNVAGSGNTGGKPPVAKKDGPSDQDLLKQLGQIMLNPAE